LKRSYGAKQEALLEQLRPRLEQGKVVAAGLAVLLRLPDGISDIAIIDALRPFGMSPSPLSLWYANAETTRSGLLLGVATSPAKTLAKSCEHLMKVVRNSKAQ
jgi:GntR family transcriptional regulator/MocR family aminotransferase